jgi:hypothetical protein
MGPSGMDGKFQNLISNLIFFYLKKQFTNFFIFFYKHDFQIATNWMASYKFWIIFFKKHFLLTFLSLYFVGTCSEPFKTIELSFVKLLLGKVLYYRYTIISSIDIIITF